MDSPVCRKPGDVCLGSVQEGGMAGAVETSQGNYSVFQGPWFRRRGHASTWISPTPTI